MTPRPRTAVEFLEAERDQARDLVDECRRRLETHRHDSPGPGRERVWTEYEIAKQHFQVVRRLLRRARGAK